MDFNPLVRVTALCLLVFGAWLLLFKYDEPLAGVIGAMALLQSFGMFFITIISKDQRNNRR